MRTLKEIQSILRRNKAALMEKYPIDSIAIFGSYARNQASLESDLDVLVEVDGKIGSRFIDLAIELEDILGVKVDLVSKHGIKEKYFSLIEPELLYV